MRGALRARRATALRTVASARERPALLMKDAEDGVGGHALLAPGRPVPPGCAQRKRRSQDAGLARSGRYACQYGSQEHARKPGVDTSVTVRYK